MDIPTLHRRAVEHWQGVVELVGVDQWDNVTPCTDWSVRELVNHVVGEELWMVPLLGGATIDDVGGRFDGDLLGDDPVSVARSAATAAVATGDEILPSNPKVHLSYGDEEATEYAMQLIADHLVHSWDLAKSTGHDATLDPDLVEAVGTWFAEREDLYRGAGVIGPRVEQSGGAQTDLLAAFGREADWRPRGAG
jgi:uncharacterized protein (TIGR03086 family)